MRKVPDSELQISFARSGGKGGQNVNKTSTKTRVVWVIGRSRVFSPEEKDRIRQRLARRLTAGDEIAVTAEEERSQAQNRARAVSRLQDLVSQALRIPKKRRPTRPTKASGQRRLEFKARHSRQKKNRRLIYD